MRPLVTLLLCLTVLLAGCATPSYYPHESRDNVHVGKGGSRFTVGGIDVWFNGEPSHTYSILGYIEDNRSTGIDERHKSIPEDILQKAMDVGADGLIENVVTTRGPSGPSSGMILHGGTGGMGMGFGFGFPVNDQRITVRYTAVKYLD